MAAANEAPPGPDTARNEDGNIIRERARWGPQDFTFFIHEIVNVRIPYGKNKHFFVKGEIVEESKCFYLVKYKNPSPEGNIPGKNFCIDAINKKNHIILSKIGPYVESQSHAAKGPDTTAPNPYTVH